MRTSDILLVLSALAGGGLACAPRAVPDATEVPTGPRRQSEASCRHELGRCGGHKPGDGACGATAPGGPAPDAARALFDDVIIEPGKFAEINLEMPEGSSTEVEFHAMGGALEWNVHSHDGDNVVIHAEGAAAAGKVRFAAPRAGLFSYLWKNAGASPVRLTARLTANGAVRVHSLHPTP